MAWAPMVLSLVGSGVSAAGQYQTGIDTKKAYDTYASQIETAGGFEQSKMIGAIESLSSTQRALYAKSGVRMTGSPLEVMLQSASDAEFDRMIAEWNYRTQAQNARTSGRNAKTAGAMAATSTLIGGAAKAYGNYGGGRVPTKTAEGGPSGTLTMG